jgi:hypothetical protein
VPANTLIVSVLEEEEPLYVKPELSEPVPLSEFVIVIVTAPVPVGTVQVSWVELWTLTLVASAEPNATVQFASKPEPVIVTLVPAAPVSGETLLTVTCEAPFVYAKPFLLWSRVPSLFSTVTMTEPRAFPGGVTHVSEPLPVDAVPVQGTPFR